MKDSISFIIASLCKCHRSLAHELLHQEVNLHVGQEMFLYYLWQCDGIPQSELAKKLNIQQATIAKSTKRMEDQGLVKREKDSKDNRVSLVYLTEKGKNLQKKVNETWNILEKHTIAGLTQEERIILRQLLIRVSENIKKIH